MTRFARMDSGRVAEIIEIPADGPAIADRYHPDIAATIIAAPGDAEAGWLYDGQQFSPPQVDEAPPAPAIRLITALSFRRRLSPARRADITLAASQALDAGDASLQVFLDDLSASQVADLDDPELLAGVDAMLDAELITSAERDTLLLDGTASEAA